MCSFLRDICDDTQVIASERWLRPTLGGSDRPGTGSPGDLSILS